MPSITFEPLTRIEFGRTVGLAGIQGRHIFAHSANGRSHDPPMFVLEPKVQAQIKSLPFKPDPEASPYLDQRGAVRSLAEKLFEGSTSPDESLARTVALLNDDSFFQFATDRMASDSLFSAGLTLTDGSRVAGTPSQTRLFTHIFEPYIFASKLLRDGGMDAFPALAITHWSGVEELHPIISVIDNSDIPLKTCSLFTAHPPMCSLLILDDPSMTAVTYAMLAQNRVKDFADEIVGKMLERRTIPSEAYVAKMIHSIADALLPSHLMWPFNFFIRQSIDFLGENVNLRLSSIAVASRINADDLARVLKISESFSQMLMRRLDDLLRFKAAPLGGPRN